MNEPTKQEEAQTVSGSRHDRMVMLPKYQSKKTREQINETRKWVAYQLKNIKEQEAMGTPSKFVKVRCACNKYVQWHAMFRCLYCGVWFCKSCAEEHFGMRVPEAT